MSKKFKVGDRVVGIGYQDGVDLTGMIGTIKKVHDYSFYNYSVEFDDVKETFHSCGGVCRHNHGWNVEEHHIKLNINETIVIYRKGDEVIAHNKANDKKGIAKCSKEDTFDFEVGAKLAFERLMGTEVKEVRRLANVGEYIKIVKASSPYGYYRNGDIIKVTQSDLNNVMGLNLRTNKGTILIWNYEYVVLENYKPTEPIKEPKKLYNGKVVCIEVDYEGSKHYTVGKIYEFKDGKTVDNNGLTRPRHTTPIESFEDLCFKSTHEKFIEVVE